MRTHHSLRSRITTTLAASAVAAGALLGGFAMAGSAAAEPDFDSSQLQKCTAYMDADGNMKEPTPYACLPVDPFTEPGLTVGQRLHLLNPESPIYDQMVHEIETKYGK